MKKLLIGLVLMGLAASAHAAYNADPAGSPTFNGGNVAGFQAGLAYDFMGTPSASAKIVIVCPTTLNFPSGLTSPTSYAKCGTNPGETDDYLIKVNGTQKGDISLSTSCVATLTAASSFTCTAGQAIEMDAPATVSGTDIGFVLGYTR